MLECVCVCLCLHLCMHEWVWIRDRVYDYTTVCKSIGLNLCSTLVSVFSALSKQTDRSLQQGEKCAAWNISLVLTRLIIFSALHQPAHLKHSCPLTVAENSRHMLVKKHIKASNIHNFLFSSNNILFYTYLYLIYYIAHILFHVYTVFVTLTNSCFLL